MNDSFSLEKRRARHENEHHGLFSGYESPRGAVDERTFVLSVVVNPPAAFDERMDIMFVLSGFESARGADDDTDANTDKEEHRVLRLGVIFYTDGTNSR